MIIFHTIPDLDICINNLKQYVKPLEWYNLIEFTLFGQVQRGPTLGIMPKQEYIPREIILDDTESYFDYYYWIQLEKDPETFVNKMGILEIEYLSGANTIIAIQTNASPYRLSITESIMGYIRTFYGLETKLILTPEDFVDPDFFNYSGFSVEGLYRLSEDLTKAALMRGEKINDNFV